MCLSKGDETMVDGAAAACRRVGCTANTAVVCVPVAFAVLAERQQAEGVCVLGEGGRMAA